MAWTDEKIESLKRCVAAGMSSTLISERLGVGRGAVIGKCNRLGLRLLGAKTKPKGRPAGRVETKPRKPKRKPQTKPLNFGAAKSLQHPKRAPGETPPPSPPPALTHPENMPRVSIFETGNSRCKWPLWADGDEHRDCCGLPVDQGSYCAHHRRLAYGCKKHKPENPDRARTGFHFSARSLPVLSKGA